MEHEDKMKLNHCTRNLCQAEKDEGIKECVCLGQYYFEFMREVRAESLLEDENDGIPDELELGPGQLEQFHVQYHKPFRTERYKEWWGEDFLPRS